MRRRWKLSPSSIPRLFLQRSSSATRPFTGAGVGTGTLTAYRQATLVAHAPVGSQVDQTLDRQLYFTTQVALYREHTYVLADALEFSVSQIFHFLGIFDARCFADLAGAGTTDTKNRGKSDFGVLMRRNVDASNTCHDCSLLNPLRFGLSLDAAYDVGRCR